MADELTDSDSRFPRARSSYSCEACRRDDHESCKIELVSAQGSVYSQPCACYEAAPDEHPTIVRWLKVSAADWKALARDAAWEGKRMPDYIVDAALGRTRKGC